MIYYWLILVNYIVSINITDLLSSLENLSFVNYRAMNEKKKDSVIANDGKGTLGLCKKNCCQNLRMLDLLLLSVAIT